MSQFGSGSLPVTLTTVGQQEVGQVAVARVYWYNPVTVGDIFILTNNEGKLIVRGRCEVANQSQFFDFSAIPLSTDGYGIAALSSGQLDIYTV